MNMKTTTNSKMNPSLTTSSTANANPNLHPEGLPPGTAVLHGSARHSRGRFAGVLAIALAGSCWLTGQTAWGQTNSPALIPIATSTFDDSAAGADGWLQTIEYQQSTPPTYQSSSGFTGGGIASTTGDFFVAPAKFLGNQSRAYGGDLRFDLKQNKTSGFTRGWDVRLHSSGMILVNRYPQQPPTVWTTFEFTLHEGHGWVNRDAGRDATREELIGALSNLEAIWIRADYGNSSLAQLDNVMLLAQPSGPIQPILAAGTYGGITIQGQVGTSYRIEYTATPNGTNSWQKLTDVLLPSSPYLFIDQSSPSAAVRFYRAVLN